MGAELVRKDLSCKLESFIRVFEAGDELAEFCTRKARRSNDFVEVGSEWV